MKTAVLRLRCAYTFIACVLFAGAIQAQQQGNNAALPTELLNLPASSFVVEALALRENSETPPEVRGALEQRAATLLAGYDFAQVGSEEYPLLYELHRVAGGSADSDLQKRIRDALTKRVDDWTDRPYEEIRGKVALMIRLKMHFKGFNEAQRWLAAGGTYDKILQSEQGQEDLTNPHAPLAIKVLFGNAQKVLGNFSIVWEGQLTPTKSGAHTFSISPINVNAIHDNYHVQQTMSVSVGGQQIIHATPEAWESESAPVTLTAGQAVPVRVETRVESANFPRGALHAMLFWQGPGISKATVPPEVFTQPGTTTRGLKATYTFRDEGEERSLAQTDRDIDFAWPLGGLVVAGDAAKNKMADDLAGVLWDRMSAVNLLDALEQSGDLHPLLEAAESAAGNLRSSQRKMFLEILVSRPALLEPLPPGKLLWLFKAFRLGAPDAALDMLAVWTKQRANHASELPDYVAQAYIDNEMRKACRQLAICVTQEMPAQRLRLRDEHLELEDGTCCLPVAYILGYSHQSLGQMSEWIALLDQKLNDQSLGGEKRVNWLIARAQAEEIRQGSTEPFAEPTERLLDGRGWLDEGRLMAETPATRSRLAKEVAARLAATEQFDAAREALEQLGSGLPADVAAQVAQWRKSIDAFEAQHVASRDKQATDAKTAYLETLRKRREAASARGDQQSAARYDALIQAAGNR